MNPRLLVVLGPTGTGKSELAVELALRVGGEIVGCDAVQVYRGVDAATAKPDARGRARVPHHLVDVVDPRSGHSMADHVEAADRAIRSIRSRGRVSLVVGGTGLYLRGLLRGVLASPPRDAALRSRLRRIADRGGRPHLCRLLRRLDPDSAARIAQADVQRLVRALEMALGGGESWSERLRREGTWKAAAERYPSLKVGLDLDREVHDRLLDRRVDRFFEAGLVEEVRRLLAAGVPPDANALKGIGYREVLAALARGDDPETVRDEVRTSTRRYARRQRRWFRGETDVVWLDAARPDLVERILELWERARQ